MTSTGGVPYLGSKISLVSKADIRYEGILYTIDPNECTVALAKVRSFGTEERPTERPVSARDDVFEYIIFRGSDIKDLNVCEPPKAQLTLAHLQDPAIVKQSGPVHSSATQLPSFGAESSAPMVPAVSAALNGALGIQTATHQYVKAKLGEIAPQISKKTAPPPLQTIPPKSPEPQSPSKPDSQPVSRARRSPGNRRRGTGSGRVIPQSPKEALLAELMGPQAVMPAEAAKSASEAIAMASAISSTPVALPVVDGSPTKGRRRRRNGATLRTSASSAVAPLVPPPSVAAADPSGPESAPASIAVSLAPPTGPPPGAESAEMREARQQRSPRRIKSTRRRGGRLSVSKDDSRMAPSQSEAQKENQAPISTSTPSATAPSRGRNAASNTSVSRGARGRGAARGNSSSNMGRGGAARQPNPQKQMFSGPGFQTNYFQGFQAGFNQALQQAYFNASVSGLFSPPVQRGGFTRRGRGRGMTRGGISRGGATYTPRGGMHAAGSAAYGPGFNPRHAPAYPQAPTQVRSFDPCAFVGDYDFEEANSKFDKGKVQEEYNYGHLEATGNPEKDRENAVASKESAAAALQAAVQEAAASLGGVAGAAAAGTEYSPGAYNARGEYFYDKTRSFYDKISCTSVDKLPHYAHPVTEQTPAGNRVTWREARALNSETFGVPSVAAARRFVQGGVPPSQAHLYHISPSPRGRGRGFFQRGRGWSPRIRGGWSGRGRGAYHPNSYYAGHINDYHGTDPSTHLTAALAAAAASLPQKTFPTSPLIDANLHLTLPTKAAAPTTPLAQSRLILEPTPSNTPIALPNMNPSIAEEIAVSNMAASAATSSAPTSDSRSPKRSFGAASGSDPANSVPNVVLSKPEEVEVLESEIMVTAPSVDSTASVAETAPVENVQESVLKETQDVAAAPPTGLEFAFAVCTTKAL